MFNIIQQLFSTGSLLLIFLLFISPTILGQSIDKKQQLSQWRLWKETKSKSVYYRKYFDGPLIEIKANVKVRSSLSAALLFLQDGKNVSSWLHNASSSKILNIISSNENVSIFKFDAFWPVSEREMIIRSHYWQNSDLSIDVISSDEGKNYEKFKSKNTVLVKLLSAHWRISLSSENYITIENTVIVDPQGAIPYWLSNRIALKSTWKTLSNLAEQLPTSTYQNKVVSGITEK